MISLYSSPKSDLEDEDSPMVLLITSCERLSLAFNSMYSENSLAIACANVVFPIPGGPTKSMGCCGLPFFQFSTQDSIIFFSLLLPNISFRVFGRYLSVHNIRIPYYKNFVKRASSCILGFDPSLILKSQLAIASIISI